MSNKTTDSKRETHNTRRASELAAKGEMILERKFQITKDEQQYFSNDRVYTNINMIGKGKSKSPNRNEEPGQEHIRYQQNVPSYFRIMDNPNNRNVVHRDATSGGEPSAMMQIISKHQEWITVDATNGSRSRPVEKERLGDASKVNRLSPNWMQVTHEKPGPDPLRANVIKHGVRKETNRSILVERDQP